MTPGMAADTVNATPPTHAAIVWRALGLIAVAAALVALVALAVAGTRWKASGSTLEWTGDRFNVAGGQALSRDGALVIERSDARGAFIAALPTARFDASDYAAIEIDVSRLPERTPIAVFWRSRLTGDSTFSHPADIDTGRGVRAQLDRDPNWKGPINGIGVIVAGAAARGVSIDAVRAVGASPVAMTIDALRSWFRVEPWNNQSINVVFLGGQYQAFPFTLFVGLITLLALLAWFLWQRKAPLPVIAGGALVIVFASWIAMDLRWLANLGRVEAQTVTTLAGKSWRDKRLAAQDGALFAFIDKVREHVAERPARVFFTSDDAWIRVRGGYHLLPFNTLSIAYHRNLFEPSRYRPGDWLCFYGRSGVVYDPATQSLRWDGGAPLKAERVMAGDGGALYRVLPP
jgi:hypothetical protein